jgi:hypothetical protein
MSECLCICPGAPMKHTPSMMCLSSFFLNYFLYGESLLIITGYKLVVCQVLDICYTIGYTSGKLNLHNTVPGGIVKHIIWVAEDPKKVCT